MSIISVFINILLGVPVVVNRTELHHCTHMLKKDLYRREGKCLLCVLGDIIASKFLASLAIFHQDELNNRLILQLVLVQISLFFKSFWCKIASAARK